MRVISSLIKSSAHKLNIEMGRYQKIELENRKCTCCLESVIEDEVHFITQCHAYTEERRMLYQEAKLQCKHFANLSDENKFIWLMTVEDYKLITPWGHIYSMPLKKGQG